MAMITTAQAYPCDDDYDDVLCLCGDSESAVAKSTERKCNYAYLVI